MSLLANPDDFMVFELGTLHLTRFKSNGILKRLDEQITLDLMAGTSLERPSKTACLTTLLY